MKTKWNLLVVVALLAALVGGIASPAEAEGESYAVSIYAVQGNVQNPEAAFTFPSIAARLPGR